MLFGRHINRYYLKYLPLYIIGIIALIAVDFVQLYIPQYLGEVVDILQNNGDTARIGTLALKVLIVAGIMFVGRFIWRVTLVNSGFKIEADLRHEMFLKAEALPREYYHDNKVGSIMSWFTNDLETISECMQWGTIMIIDALFLSAITIVQMILLDKIMTLICASPLVLIILNGCGIYRGLPCGLVICQILVIGGYLVRKGSLGADLHYPVCGGLHKLMVVAGENGLLVYPVL